jgi:itaconate CoA-transferase
MRHPLAGITVVALEQAVAAPFATRQLADLGARVIKIERPGAGDFARGYDRTVHGQSSYFVWLNRGKESVELDIKQDRALLDALVAGADVFVQNLVPGAVERLGLDAQTLRASRPSLIHCSVSGYGPDGPYRSKKAYDLLVQCETGLVMSTGTQEAPAKAGISIADIATGMYAYSGILTALYDRERTGEGASLHVAMIDALGEWMSQPAYFSRYGKEEPRRTAARHPSISPYGPYRTGEGIVFLGIQNDREWSALCHEVLARPELVADPRFHTNPDRVDNNDELTTILEKTFADLDADQVVELLERAGIANARLRTRNSSPGIPSWMPATAGARWRLPAA